MEEVSDVQALEKISSEVDESQVKVILSSQCIKAQAFLLDKLKKQADRHKETCSFISSANLKVEMEIKQAEHEIRSLLIAQDTIKSANIEIRKEYLLAKDRKEDIIERVTEGKQKYENLWVECKTRYESIPFVQTLLQTNEKQTTIERDIDDLDKQITKLYEDIEIRRNECAELDKKRAIELANFMVNEMPKAINVIKEKAQIIDKLNIEIEQLLKDQVRGDEVELVTEKPTMSSNTTETVQDVEMNKEDRSKINYGAEDDPLIPKLNLANFDLDSMDVSLDQVKMKKNEIFNTIPTEADYKKYNVEQNVERLDSEKAYDSFISPYFKPYKEVQSRNFSERKLINILEDINIGNSEACSLVKKVNPEKLKPVEEIAAQETASKKTSPSFSKRKGDKLIVSQDIEEIDLRTLPTPEDILVPPSQFLDMTLSDDTTKKRVSFDLPSSVQINEIPDDGKQNEDEANECVNETMNSQLDVSATSNESFAKIKDMLLKKHNLDLSPQFVYAKNNVLLKSDDDKIVTSKFFQCRNENSIINTQNVAMEVDEQQTNKKIQDTSDREIQSQRDTNENEPMRMDIDEAVVSSPKPIDEHLGITQKQSSEKIVTGLLFTHGAQAIPDSLNVSMSTTGYEDSDFPHCIDSSLLLSPKADIPGNDDQQGVMSQEVPNFLSGFCKTGLSFFGGPSTSSESKPDSSAQNDENNFNFNFGGEKKNRGGLLSLFR